MGGQTSPTDSRGTDSSRTPRRATARIALHAGAIPHQREVAALAAHLAFVAFGLGFGAAFGLGRGGGLRAAGLAPLQGFQLLGWREVVARFLLQRDRAFDGVAGAGGCAVGGQRGDAAAGAVAARRPASSRRAS